MMLFRDDVVKSVDSFWEDVLLSVISDWRSSAGLTTNPGLRKVLRQRWHM